VRVSATTASRHVWRRMMEMDALCATSRTPGEQEDVSDVLKIKSYVIFIFLI
jgi:hypothetical protein